MTEATAGQSGAGILETNDTDNKASRKRLQREVWIGSHLKENAYLKYHVQNIAGQSEY